MNFVKKFGGLFRDSAKFMKNYRHITLVSIFIAYTIIGNLIQISVTKDLSIKFGFVFAAFTAYLYGPTIAAFSGVAVDLLEYMITSGGGYAFDIRFTLNAALAGIIYGIFLYRKNPESKFFMVNIFCAKFFVNFIINVTLTPIWLNGLYGAAGNMFATARLYKNIVMLPIEIILICFIIKALTKVLKKSKFIAI